MIYAGIDIAKLNHFASVISSDGEVLVEPFQFSNDLEGFRSLSLVLDRYDRDQLLIGLESTVHYSNNLLLYICPSFLAASQRHGPSRCLSCTMWRQWSGVCFQELIARDLVNQPTFH